MSNKIPQGYRSQASDCRVEIDWLQFEKLRSLTITQRLAIAIASIRNARKFSLTCLQRNFAQLDLERFNRKLALTWLGEDCPPHYIPTSSFMNWIQDSISLAGELHSILLAENIAYYVTGGVAAIAYGEPRTTQNLDIVIYVSTVQLERLVKKLTESGFYVAGVEDVVIGQMSTIQVTQIETISRADIIITTDDEYEQLKLIRRQAYMLPNGSEVFVASAEDAIISKLLWRKKSQSDKQWRDILGIFKTQQDNLDFTYLLQWSERLVILAAYQQAIIEAGVSAIAEKQLRNGK